MASKLPYMPVWVFDIETDESCMMLEAAGFGLYMRLLFRQWIEGSIPGDIEHIARIVREPIATVRLTSGFIEDKFPMCPDGRRRNDRCHQERENCLAKVDTNRKNGRKGGRPRKLDHVGDDNQSETERLTESEPNSSTRVSGSGSMSLSSSLKNKEETNFQANIPLLTRIGQIWKKTKRGGPTKWRRLLADALSHLEVVEGEEHPVKRLMAQMTAYMASDKGRSKFCLGLANWLEDGCYLQHPSEWQNDVDMKGDAPPVGYQHIKKKLVAAQAHLDGLHPDDDQERAEWTAIVSKWEQRLEEATEAA